ncbi:AP-1 complex subunit gamma [Trichinella pseudospiralis]
MDVNTDRGKTASAPVADAESGRFTSRSISNAASIVKPKVNFPLLLNTAFKSETISKLCKHLPCKRPPPEANFFAVEVELAIGPVEPNLISVNANNTMQLNEW